MARAFFGIGSNIGDRLANLRQAIARLHDEMTVTTISPVYQTEPWGEKAQPAFLNICVAAETSIDPHDLLHLIKQIEREIGRTPGRHWGPRLIDIDILFYDALIVNDDELSIPHPFLPQRAFVLAPLADIIPNFVHPVNGQTVQEMYLAVDNHTVEQIGELAFPVSLVKL
jgi:2-amino-4-hydroxy-6-hydroxymethyldihydropteridine diphosphokinase